MKATDPDNVIHGAPCENDTTVTAALSQQCIEMLASKLKGAQN